MQNASVWIGGPEKRGGKLGVLNEELQRNQAALLTQPRTHRRETWKQVDSTEKSIGALLKTHSERLVPPVAIYSHTYSACRVFFQLCRVTVFY